MQYNGKFINPYEILALPHASDFELVKATYKSLVKIYHPDELCPKVGDGLIRRRFEVA